MAKTDLSVIICTYNRGESLRRCLASIERSAKCEVRSSGRIQNPKTQYSVLRTQNYEIIIIDGGSTDTTNEVIQEYAKILRIKKVVYLSKELARVRDRGWREAKGKIVAWIDDDVVVSPGWMENLLATFRENPDIGGVSGPTVIPARLLVNRDVFSFYRGQGWQKYLGRWWDRILLEGGRFEVGKLCKSGAWTPGSNLPSCLELKGLQEVDYLEACNMALRRELVDKVGGYDYGFTKVAEWSELDLAIRVKKLGYRLVFNPKVKVAHHISRGGVFKRRTAAKQRMENFFRFYFRHVFKPEIDYGWRFLAYLIFLNGYWTYKAATERNPDWLGGWVGTVTGWSQIGARVRRG